MITHIPMVIIIQNSVDSSTARCLFVRQKVILPFGECKNSQLVFLMEAKRRYSGRPKLSEGKRVKIVNVRFTETEYNSLENLEKELGLTKTELIRMRVLDDAEKVVVNSREILLYLDETGANLARIGNNINQLARHANTLKLQNLLHPGIMISYERSLDEYIIVLQQIDMALRKIIRQLGK